MSVTPNASLDMSHNAGLIGARILASERCGSVTTVRIPPSIGEQRFVITVLTPALPTPEKDKPE